MGVPSNHCEKILENLHNLRQTMFGQVPKPSDRDFHYYNKYNPSLNPAVCALKTVAMNANYRGMSQYPEEYSGYGQSGNSMQAMGFHPGTYENSNMAMLNPMSGSGGGSYPVAGYDASQSHMMMASQGQMSAHPAMYQQHSQQQAYMAQHQQHQQQQQQQQQYYASSSSGSSGSGGSTGAQYSSQAYPMQGGGNMPAMGGSSPYYNTGSSQSQGTGGSKMVPPAHHHLRNTSGQQNPQQVADNILQMASSFPSQHTVQVPLKNRHAPYQIPRSPQSYYPEKGGSQQPGMGGQAPQQAMHNSQSMVGSQAMACGQMQGQTPLPQGQASGMNHSPATMYAGSSPHSQMQHNSSPTSPLMMPSPVATHQAQGLSSPGALHSPSSTAVCSPVPSSPGLANMRSPSSMPMRSPAHLTSGYSNQPLNSPPQRPYAAAESGGAQHCSPTSMHSPASHSSSPYMTHHVNSPPGSQGYSVPASSPYKMHMLMDSGQGPGLPRTQGMHGQASDPLQSLQKLVMLPETQVVDPKSVVSDGCMQNCDEGSKNSEGPAEQSREADCSAGVFVNTSSPPTADAPQTEHSPQGKTSTEPVSPVHQSTEGQADSVSVSPHRVQETTLPSVSSNSALTVKETSCSTVSLPKSQPEAPPTTWDTTGASSTSLQINSPASLIDSAANLNTAHCPNACKADTQNQNVTASEVCHSESSVSRTESSQAPDSTVAGQVEENSTPEGDSSAVSALVQCNGPVSQSESNPDKVDESLTSGSSLAAVCGDDSSVTEVQPQAADDAGVPTEDSTSHKDKADSSVDTAVKPSPPKLRHSRRLQGFTVKSDTVSSALTDNNSPTNNDSDKKAGPKNSVPQHSDSTKSSPPKKRHKGRLSNPSNSKPATNSNAVKTEADSDCGSNSTNNTVSTDAPCKGELVNGFDVKPVSGVDTDSAITTEQKVHHKNHIKSLNKQQKSKCLETYDESQNASVIAKSKHRELIPTRVACMVGTVNGPASGGLLPSCDVIDLAESDGEDLVQGGVPASISSSRVLTAGVPGQATGRLHSHPLCEEEEEDSNSNELDFGYDSPPCEMQGSDDSWKPDFDKQRCTNGVDEADGNLECAEKDSDSKPANLNSKGSTNAAAVATDNATDFVRTRSVTRSVTGRAPKRKQPDSDPTDSKRTRRCSGATDQQYAISLSMECDEIHSKDRLSDVEVISSSDDSSVKVAAPSNKKKTDTIAECAQTQSVTQTVGKKNHKKSPVVMLSKSPARRIKAEKRTSPIGDRMVPFRNFYSVRGAGGKFISRQTVRGSSSHTVTSSADAPTSPFLLHTRTTESCSASVQGTRKPEETAWKLPKPFSAASSSDLSRATVHAKFNAKLCPQTVAVKASSTSCPSSDLLIKVSDRPASSIPFKPAESKKTEARPLTNNKTKKIVKKKKTANLFNEMDSVDDSFKSMKFSQTLNHLQRSKKGDKSQSLFSPFVRVEGKHSTPSTVAVFNIPPADTKDSKSSNKTKSAASITAPTSTIQITNFSSDKSVMMPSTKTTDSSWVCALCGKRSSYRFLGDLFGPYFLESHLPNLAKYSGDGGKKDSKQATAGLSEVQNPHNTRRKSLSLHHSSSTEETVVIPREVWVHEDCVMWSSGVYVVGSRMYGLEEALKATTATMCACCQEKGALIGCLHKGCNQNFHYICAVDKMCFLDVENFSMLCPKHKDKRMKSASASTSAS